MSSMALAQEGVEGVINLRGNEPATDTPARDTVCWERPQHAAQGLAGRQAKCQGDTHDTLTQ